MPITPVPETPPMKIARNANTRLRQHQANAHKAS